MFLIMNQNHQAFSRVTASDAFIYIEHWVSKIDFDHNLPLNITIYPSEGMAQTVINNILACRSVKDERNKNEVLSIVPFNEFFKEN